MTKIFPSVVYRCQHFWYCCCSSNAGCAARAGTAGTMPVASGLWSGLASRLQRVYAVPIAPRAVVVAPGPVVVGPGACGGRGSHRVCNGYRCWRVCNW